MPLDNAAFSVEVRGDKVAFVSELPEERITFAFVARWE